MKLFIKISAILYLLLFSKQIFAQIDNFTAGCESDSIHFVDLIQDVYLSAPFGEYDEFDVDLDDNGVNDFSFITYWSPTMGVVVRYIHLVPYGQNKIAIGRTDTSNIHIYNPDTSFRQVIKVLNFGDTISEELFLLNETAVLAEREWWEGGYITYNITDWINIGDKYIGCCIYTDTTYFYSWIKVNVLNYHSLTIKEFAVNLDISTGIVKKNDGNDINIYPIPASSFIYLKSEKSWLDEATFEVMNFQGQPLSIRQNKIKKDLIEIKLNSYEPGVYFIRIMWENKNQVKKIIIL
jgi:hypothetical protein